MHSRVECPGLRQVIHWMAWQIHVSSSIGRARWRAVMDILYDVCGYPVTRPDQ